MTAKPVALPQAEGATWFVVVDPEENDTHFCYDAALGRHFGHEHIMDAIQDPDLAEHAKKWVVRPAYAAPVDDTALLRQCYESLTLLEVEQLSPAERAYTKVSGLLAALRERLKGSE